MHSSRDGWLWCIEISLLCQCTERGGVGYIRYYQSLSNNTRAMNAKPIKCIAVYHCLSHNTLNEHKG